MRLLITGFVFTLSVFSIAFSQVTTTFNYTGSPQSWTVPACVSSITVTAGGAEGGGNLGGSGATITATIPVTPGQVVTVNIGGSGGSASAGYGGGG